MGDLLALSPAFWVLTLGAPFQPPQRSFAGAREVEGEDASKERRFHWNRAMVPAGKEPVQMRQHRQREAR